jgi:hypothetical protein
LTAAICLRVGDWNPLTYCLLAAVFGFPISAICKYGARFLVPGAVENLRAGGRPPVILLRAFRDDKTKVDPPPFSSSPLRYLTTPGRTTLEEIVAAKLSQLGPVICIGCPGELVPPAGFLRLWVGDDDWKAVVEDCLEVCQLVAMILGRIATEDDGLAWELSKLTAMDNPERIVLIAPPLRGGESSARWDAYSRLSSGRVPSQLMDLRPILVGFRHEWSCAIRTAGHGRFDQGDYEAALDDYLMWRRGQTPSVAFQSVTSRWGVCRLE